MSRPKITVSAVNALRPGQELRDGQLRGFGARCQTHAVTYFVQARVGGQLKRVTLGTHGSPWTPETIRKLAAQTLVELKAGEDPTQKRAEKRQQAHPFHYVAEQFLELHGRILKPTTLATYSCLLKLQLNPVFGAKSIARITPADVAKFHAAWKHKPRTANHAIALLSKIINWSKTHGYGAPASNPCDGLVRYRENKRKRYLTEPELNRLGEALVAAEADGENPWVIGLVRMLLFTGARLSEMLTLKWEYVDLPRQALHLPDSKTGEKTIRLNPHAIDVLTSMPRISGNPWAFPGHITGSHLVNIQKPWRALRARAGLDDVHLHDIRHSFATAAISVGGTLPIIGKLLGHSQAHTTERYAHVAPDPAQNIADATGDKIAAALRRTASAS